MSRCEVYDGTFWGMAFWAWAKIMIPGRFMNSEHFCIRAHLAGSANVISLLKSLSSSSTILPYRRLHNDTAQTSINRPSGTYALAHM